MYKVRFSYDEPSSPVVEVFNSKQIEDAIQFALMFHRSSNVPHLISVSDGDRESVVFKLSAKLNQK